MAGPPTRYIPFNLVARLAKYSLANMLKSEDTAELFVRKGLFDPMNEAERETFARWRDLLGVTEGKLEREMAGNFVRSVAHTWQGFIDIATVYHSGWGGYHPDSLDEDQSRRPVFVVTSRNDYIAPAAMAEWLAANYKNARLKVVDGGHLSGLFYMDEIWKEFLE
jgi:pimeloyl-ACP methyl ester carboxylesterase